MSKRDPDQLLKLSDVLRKHLEDKAITVAEAARKLGLNERSLRSWLRENKFPKDVAEAAALLCDLPPDVELLQKQYSFKLPERSRAMEVDVKHKQTQLLKGKPDERQTRDGGLLEVVELFEERFKQAAKSYFTEFEQDVEAIFRAMGEGDIFVYCSFDELPMETLPVNSRILPLVAEAITKGAYFIYIYPDDRVIARLEECRIRPRYSSRHFTENLKTFQEKLSKHSTAAALKRHVAAIPTPHCAFMVPGHKYVLYRPNDSDSPPPPLQICFDPFYRHIPLSDRVTNDFLSFIDVVFDQVGREDLKNLFA